MKSPDGRFEVVCSDYGEIRMGSPEFGSIQIVGSSFSPKGRSFGDAMSFSPDSRYLAISELVEAAHPSSRVIVFDRKRKIEWIVFARDPGLIKKVEWISPEEMKILSWSHLHGDEYSSWKAPKEEPEMNSKPLWKFWK
jgi:hypothetical protein